jgi:hypothetical protein
MKLPKEKKSSKTRPPPLLKFVPNDNVKRSKRVVDANQRPEVLRVPVGLIEVPTNYHLAQELVQTGQAGLGGVGNLQELTGIEPERVKCLNNNMYRFAGGDHEVVILRDMMVGGDTFSLIMQTLIEEYVRHGDPKSFAWKRNGTKMTKIRLEGDALAQCLQQSMDPDFKSPHPFFHPVKKNGRTNYYKCAFMSWMFRNGTFPLGWKTHSGKSGGRTDIWATCTHFCFVAPVGSYKTLNDGKRPVHAVQ